MDLRVCCGASMAGLTLQVTVLLLGSAKCALQLHQLSLLVVIWISGFFYLTSAIMVCSTGAKDEIIKQTQFPRAVCW